MISDTNKFAERTEELDKKTSVRVELVKNIFDVKVFFQVCPKSFSTPKNGKTWFIFTRPYKSSTRHDRPTSSHCQKGSYQDSKASKTVFISNQESHEVVHFYHLPKISTDYILLITQSARKKHCSHRKICHTAFTKVGSKSEIV